MHAYILTFVHVSIAELCYTSNIKRMCKEEMENMCPTVIAKSYPMGMSEENVQVRRR